MSIVFLRNFLRILLKGEIGMIYERIKHLCKQNGLSVNLLEKELGLSRGSLCKIDKHKPSTEKMQTLAKRLGTTVDYLISGEENKFSPEMALIDIELSNMPLELKEYALKLNKMPIEKQKQIMSLIDMLNN